MLLDLKAKGKIFKSFSALLCYYASTLSRVSTDDGSEKVKLLIYYQNKVEDV